MVSFIKSLELFAPLTPALSRKGRGSSLRLEAASLHPLREKDRMRGGLCTLRVVLRSNTLSSLRHACLGGGIGPIQPGHERCEIGALDGRSRPDA